MRIVQVLASIDDAGAGPSTSATRLAGELGRQGEEVIIRSVAGWRGNSQVGKGIEPRQCYTAHRHVLNRGPIARRVCSSSDLLHALCIDATCVDVLHSHGLWLMPNVYPSWAVKARKGGAIFVLSPRGMLGGAALEFSRLPKRAFWLVAQARAVSATSLLHATSETEVDEIRAFGLKQPVAMIPNGVDLPSDRLPAKAERRKEILYLGRLHPKKGIDTLIAAWTRVAALRPQWTLRIVGPSEGDHAEDLAALAVRLAAPRVHIEGPAFGEARATCYRQASLFVLPTRNENFAMVVAEALAAGLPVIATKGAPWAGLNSERCGWWIDGNVDAISDAIERATGLPEDELTAMGMRGHQWMQRDFSWGRVADDMRAAYRWARYGGSAPATLRFV